MRRGKNAFASRKRPLLPLLLPLLALIAVVVYEKYAGRSIASLLTIGKQTGSPGEPRGPALDNLAEDVDLLPGQAGQAAQQGGVQGGAAEEGTAEGGTAEGDDLGELQRWRLLHGMLYWAHSNPVPKPAAGKIFQQPHKARFITWEQDFAGLNNVRLQVEVLVIMAHVFRRTLVMPDHLADFMDHHNDGGEVQYTIADFFDFQDLSTWVSVITMQQYLDIRSVPQDSVLRTDRHALQAWLRSEKHTGTVYPKWDASGHVMAVPDEQGVARRRNPSFKQFAHDRDPEVYDAEAQKAITLHFMMEMPDYRLFGSVAWFWYFPSDAWQDYYYAGLRDHFHFHHDIFANASRVIHHVRQMHGGHNFNALHDRADDFAGQFPEMYISESDLVAHMKMVLGEGSAQQPLYIAVKAVNESRHGALREAFPRHVFLSDIIEDVLPGVASVFLGPIEQVVCSAADRFVGTYGSTFSGFVHRMRGHHHPGLVPDKGVYFTNFPTDPAEYQAVIRDNQPQANVAWWDQGTGKIYEGASWARELSLTWNFSRSEMKREDHVFQPVR
mmetsp:Transcript_16668/g.49845  ORF Transcript_16668/g.49845 Transcript_16668/m.49845 type:complete len:554 (-) Transcript_16668:1366-3027(-)|eukprot:CAMPEP_0206144380 /NCGR_PEP_ID=MMETSP1473-20131121/23913_1 /ASSEMBLY_ACC=CAM_ASM_001109 /TAXON_ID=1461547 /ORGANISM="Stichococcus sp, Strain RCC1054" /LENGTH=553 /DNA_ID=CAMNT_0053540193 /DNA_START=158 /DNA_END=1819 /DNA_ORIENTATION=-